MTESDARPSPPPVSAPSSTTPEAASVLIGAAPVAPEAKPPFWPQGWWKLMERRIGILPVPVLVLLVAVLTAFVISDKFPASGKTPNEVCTMLAVLAVGGFVCAEIGKRLPLIKDIGGAAIFATFIPSYLAFH